MNNTEREWRDRKIKEKETQREKNREKEDRQTDRHTHALKYDTQRKEVWSAPSKYNSNCAALGKLANDHMLQTEVIRVANEKKTRKARMC